MRFWFDEGTIATDANHGHKYRGWFNADSSGYEELYFSYDIFFPSGTDFRGWTTGAGTGTLEASPGKMPSVGGRGAFGESDLSHSFPYYDEGFTAGVRWKGHYSGDCYMSSYIYAHNLSSYLYGADSAVQYLINTQFQDPDDKPNTFYFQSNQWYNIAFRIVMNDVDPQLPEVDWDQNDLGDGSKNGLYEAFIDGKHALTIDTVMWRNISGIGTDLMRIYSEWNRWVSEDTYWYTDNFHYWYYDEDFDVPQGNTEKYSTNDTLFFPQSWSHVDFGYEE